MELADATQIKQYSMATYWAFQTLTTVGYGDFGAGNMAEYIINIFWMVIGVIFYSLLVASVTSNIAG